MTMTTTRNGKVIVKNDAYRFDQRSLALMIADVMCYPTEPQLPHEITIRQICLELEIPAHLTPITKVPITSLTPGNGKCITRNSSGNSRRSTRKETIRKFRTKGIHLEIPDAAQSTRLHKEEIHLEIPDAAQDGKSRRRTKNSKRINGNEKRQTGCNE
jgi:hypothetical protein